MAQGIKMFTDEMIDFLRQHVKGTPNKVLTEMLNEHFDTNFTPMQVQSCRCNKKIRNGINACYKKGHIPLNKGVKMSEEIREKCKSSWFKKGNIPPMYRELGSTRMSKGYLEIKVDSEKYKSGSGKLNSTRKERWLPMQQKVWIDHNGEIPSKHKIIFLDGNRFNFDINNLACVDRLTHLRMCLNHRYLKDKKLTQININISKLEKYMDKKKKELYGG